MGSNSLQCLFSLDFHTATIINKTQIATNIVGTTVLQNKSTNRHGRLFVSGVFKLNQGSYALIIDNVFT